MRQDFSGQAVTIASDLNDPNQPVATGAVYVVEGYWDDVTGGSWMYANGNPAALNYAIRSAIDGLPLDDNVLYGKINGRGYLVHVSEVSV